jgi:hypothetical protein
MFRLIFVLPLLATLSATLCVSGGTAPDTSSGVANVADFTLTAVSRANTTDSYPVFVVVDEAGVLFSYMVSRLRMLIPFFTLHGDADELICVQGAGSFDPTSLLAPRFAMNSGTLITSGNEMMKSVSSPDVMENDLIGFENFDSRFDHIKPGPFRELVSSGYFTSLK